MPDNQDNNSMDNMSINDVNELYEDVVETPDEYRFLARVAHPNTMWRNVKDYYIPDYNFCS